MYIRFVAICDILQEGSLRTFHEKKYISDSDAELGLGIFHMLIVML